MNYTQAAMKEVLGVFGIPVSPKFYSPDGYVVVALLCNAEGTPWFLEGPFREERT